MKKKVYENNVLFDFIEELRFCPSYFVIKLRFCLDA